MKDTVLIDCYIAFTQENGKFLGSGTLVSIGNTRAVLTADHVLGELPQEGDVGLVFPTRFDNSPQSAPRAPKKVPMDYLEKKRVGRGKQEAEGPDIGLLVLPPLIISRFIPSTKLFYNLAKHRTRVMENPWSIDTGIWALVGAPAEWTADAAPEAGFARVKEQPGMIGLGVVNKEYEQRGFDYLEFPVIYNASYESPNSFAGCSGGGLWHMQSSKTERGQRVITDSVLSGVAFWEYQRIDNKRIVKCHGRRSIYQQVADALSS